MVINTGHTEADILAAHRALLGHQAETTVVLSGNLPASFVETARRHGQTLVVVGRPEQASSHVRIDNAAAAIEGFDDIPETAWGASQLTTFRQDPSLILRDTL